jgi:hypothetical protein
MEKEYKHPVYRPDGEARRFTPTVLREMDIDDLLEEFKELCESMD